MIKTPKIFELCDLEIKDEMILLVQEEEKIE
jgi:hypothetical protein